MSDDQRTIFERMAAILAALPAIGKTQQNTSQGFAFRGIDDVLNALNPLLAEHGVFYLPEVLERIDGERHTKGGTTMYVVNLHVRYTFYGLRGDSVVASAWGEGTDMGDKATNKAMTGAQKYALVQAFAISTEEASKSDADAHTPEETVSGAALVRQRFSALDEAQKELLRGPWKAANLPAPAKLKGGQQVVTALRLLDELADGGRPFDEEKGGSSSSVHAHEDSDKLAGESNQLPGTTPKDAA